MTIGQYGILRFAKHKGAPAGALEAHHERKKEKYASNPDVDTKRSEYNFHNIQPTGRYRREIDNRIRAAGCRTRKDSTRFVDTSRQQVLFVSDGSDYVRLAPVVGLEGNVSFAPPGALSRLGDPVSLLRRSCSFRDWPLRVGSSLPAFGARKAPARGD